MPRPLRFLPFRGSAAVAAGLLTSAQLRGAAWRRLFPDIYIAADIELSHRLWCEAALIYASRAAPAAVSGLSAACLLGVDLLPRDPHVELTSASDVRVRTSGMTVIRSRFGSADLAAFGRLPVTSPDRTVFDVARRMERRRAVAVIDAMLHRRMTTVEAARQFAVAQSMFRDQRRVFDILPLVDGRSESAMESELRLTIVDGGLPTPESQVEIFDADGRFVARVDLAYRRRRVAIEYEGDHHRDRQTFRRDITRANALQLLDWTIVRATIDDIRSPDALLRRLRQLLDR